MPIIPQNVNYNFVKQAHVPPLKRMFFNSYAINTDRVPGFWYFTFGFIDRSSLVDQFGCVASRETIDSLVGHLGDYLNQIGLPNPEFQPIEYPDIGLTKQVEPVDLIAASRRNELAEFSLHIFQWNRAYDLVLALPEDAQLLPGVPPTINVETFTSCLLRCTLEMQKHWLATFLKKYELR